ncbi:hypothetical protein BDW_13950 [Bdellovibrio bacteriovorus W]|nr:hypothetical protein BDW_13950 [Bdellovibrio bacteriovorus W]
MSGRKSFIDWIEDNGGTFTQASIQMGHKRLSTSFEKYKQRRFEKYLRKLSEE